MSTQRRAGPSQARCKRVARLLRSDRRDDPGRWAKLSPDTRLLYVVGALVANDTGRITEARLGAAMSDETTVRRAHELLAAIHADDGRCA